MKFIAAFLALAVTASAADMFPFQLPWDDASPSITNVSWLNDKPAGRDGFVSVKDGHLFAGEKRLRIFGVNMCFSANFPTHADAEKVAARMAKFGINCVRFHHMDMFNAPAGIFAKDGRTLDPEMLDRLDYFIAALKKEGIYADLNLHVSRTYPDRPKAEKKGSPQFDKGVDNYHAPMIALQRDYARELLSHVNKYTGNAYSAEPAVALVEINNENALGFQWFAGEMDHLPAPYAEDLSAQWTAWLVKKYGAAEKAAWSEGARAAGGELIGAGRVGVSPAAPGVPPGASNDDAASPRQSTVDGSRETREPAGGTPTLPRTWVFENHGTAKAKGVAQDGAITFTVEQAGAEPWHAQFSASPIVVAGDVPYAATFRVRAPKTMKLDVNIMQAHEPWKVLGSARVNAGPEWREVRAVLRSNAADEKARLTIGGMGQTAGAFEFADFSLRAAEVRGAVVMEGKNARYIRKSELASYTQAAQRDWQEFIWDTETVYWNGMRDFLRKELGVKVPIVGTQGFWSPGHVQAGMDVIDSHAYWHHPQFEGGDWNPEKWTIKNEPMAGAKDGGTLPGLAAQRVAGKPFICTEYNHSAPNTYGAETAPLLAAFAALQDWDGVFLFAYSHNDKWSQEHFDSFFDIARHPVKMATLPGAAVMFRNERPDRLLGGKIFSLNPRINIPHALRFGPSFAGKLNAFEGLDSFREWVGFNLRFDSDRLWTQENRGQGFIQTKTWSVTFSDEEWFPFKWEPNSRQAIRTTPRSLFVIGKTPAEVSFRAAGTTLCGTNFPAPHFKMAMAESRQDWACYQLTALDGNDFITAKRVLITATGDIANTDMGWKNAEKTTVGRDWGKAPVLVEGPTAKIELPGGGKFKAWALDERGQRREEIPVVDGKLEIGPQFKTLWYEVERMP